MKARSKHIDCDGRSDTSSHCLVQYLYTFGILKSNCLDFLGLGISDDRSNPQ